MPLLGHDKETQNWAGKDQWPFIGQLSTRDNCQPRETHLLNLVFQAYKSNLGSVCNTILLNWHSKLWLAPCVQGM